MRRTVVRKTQQTGYLLLQATEPLRTKSKEGDVSETLGDTSQWWRCFVKEVTKEGTLESALHTAWSAGVDSEDLDLSPHSIMKLIGQLSDILKLLKDGLGDLLRTLHNIRVKVGRRKVELLLSKRFWYINRTTVAWLLLLFFSHALQTNWDTSFILHYYCIRVQQYRTYCPTEQITIPWGNFKNGGIPTKNYFELDPGSESYLAQM